MLRFFYLVGPSPGNSYPSIADWSDIAHAADLVRQAYDLGVNIFDTADSYGTEAAVGAGLAGLDRGSYVISTKTLVDRI